VVSFKPWPLWPRRKQPYKLNRRLAEPVWTFWRREISVTTAGNLEKRSICNNFRKFGEEKYL
jgi:hypothetical protein